MNFKKLNDAKYSVPTKLGQYQWWSRGLGYIPVLWTGLHWLSLAGDRIDNCVKWWR